MYKIYLCFFLITNIKSVNNRAFIRYASANHLYIKDKFVFKNNNQCLIQKKFMTNNSYNFYGKFGYQKIPNPINVCNAKVKKVKSYPLIVFLNFIVTAWLFLNEDGSLLNPHSEYMVINYVYELANTQESFDSTSIVEEIDKYIQVLEDKISNVDVKNDGLRSLLRKMQREFQDAKNCVDGKSNYEILNDEKLFRASYSPYALLIRYRSEKFTLSYQILADLKEIGVIDIIDEGPNKRWKFMQYPFYAYNLINFHVIKYLYEYKLKQ